MSEVNAMDRLELYDNLTLDFKKSVDMPVRYHGTRLRPFTSSNPIRSKPTSFRMMANGSKRCFCMNQTRSSPLFFYDMDKSTAKACLLSWSVNDVRSSGYMPDAKGTSHWFFRSAKSKPMPT